MVRDCVVTYICSMCMYVCMGLGVENLELGHVGDACLLFVSQGKLINWQNMSRVLMQ